MVRILFSALPLCALTAAAVAEPRPATDTGTGDALSNGSQRQLQVLSDQILDNITASHLSVPLPSFVHIHVTVDQPPPIFPIARRAMTPPPPQG